jgi:glycosyltransferase involved in cell wall biosynthesis
LTRVLAVLETHPVQYHAPVYRALEKEFSVPVTVIYGSDFSVQGYRDQEFLSTFAWDSDLLNGYASVFLSKVSFGAASSPQWVSSRGLGRALRELRPSAVLLPGRAFFFDWAAFCIAVSLRIPIFFRGEVTDHDRDRGWQRSLIRDGVLKGYYKKCRKLLYIGRQAYEHYRRLGVEESRLISSPYCVDTAFFPVDEENHARMRSLMRGTLKIQDYEKVVLYSGKFVPKKGVDFFVLAMRRLPREIRKKLVFVFVGNGPLKDRVQRMALESPALRAYFVGFKNQKDLSAYYHAADLLVLPSVYGETWGLVVNEALHHGVPCVVSDRVGCAPDLIDPGVTGEIFKAGNAEDLLAAMQRALAVSARPEIRERCSKKVGAYSVQKAAAGIAEACRSLRS